MKAIKAIVQPFMLSKVTSKLLAIANFPGMTVTEVQGFGREKAQGVPHRIVEDLVDYVPKTKIEIVASETMVDEIVRVIMNTSPVTRVMERSSFTRFPGHSGYGPERRARVHCRMDRT